MPRSSPFAARPGRGTSRRCCGCQHRGRSGATSRGHLASTRRAPAPADDESDLVPDRRRSHSTTSITVFSRVTSSIRTSTTSIVASAICWRSSTMFHPVSHLRTAAEFCAMQMQQIARLDRPEPEALAERLSVRHVGWGEELLCGSGAVFRDSARSDRRMRRSSPRPIRPASVSQPASQPSFAAAPTGKQS